MQNRADWRDVGAELSPRRRWRTRRDDLWDGLVTAGVMTEAAWGVLTNSERVVLARRFGNGFTLGGVAGMLGMSPERVRQIELKALRRLVHHAEVGLKVWLEEML